MKVKKRDKANRAFSQGFKSGVRGHEMESCPFQNNNVRGAWFAGWRDGRSSLISGYVTFPEH